MFAQLLLYILSLLLIGIIAFEYLVHYGRKGRLINEIPGPPRLPVIGHVHMFYTKVENLWRVIHDMNKEYYPILRIWRIDLPIVVILHPDDVEVLLSSMKHIQKSKIYKFLHPWLGTGLLTSTGLKWQQRRKMLTPSFHFNMLRAFVQTFDEQGRNLVKSLRSSTEVQDLMSLLSKYTLDLITETAMGTELDTLGDRQLEYRKSVYDMGRIFIYRTMRPWLFFDWCFALTGAGREQKVVLEKLHGFTNQIIDERKQYHESTDWKFSIEGKEGDVPVEGRKKRMAMLDLLLSAWREDSIDDTGIREEVDTFVFEGHDTTSAALVFIVLCLAEYKDHQQRCREEVDRVLSKSDGKLGMPELQELCFLEQCIKESLRLYPPVPTISRRLTSDLQLKDYLIPAGTVTTLHIFDIHRDPNFWKDPEVYDPDRFLPDRMSSRHPFSYIPFSAGPRNCIGQKFAMMELKAVVAHLLHDYYLEPISPLSEVLFLPDLILRPLTPVYAKFIPVN